MKLLFRHLFYALLLWTSTQNLAVPFLLNAVPKSGTNLLARILGTMTHKNPVWPSQALRICVYPSPQELNRMLSYPNSFIFSHIAYSNELAQTIEKIGLKMIVLARNPADQVCSHASFSMEQHHPVHHGTKYLSISQVISDFITNKKWHFIPSEQRYLPEVSNLSEFYSCFLRWCEKPYTLFIRYEDLIGGKEGSLKLKVKTIREIAAFLELQFTDDEIVTIVRQIDNDKQDWTFRRGKKIGKWKDYFTETHKQEFIATMDPSIIDLWSDHLSDLLNASDTLITL